MSWHWAQGNTFAGKGLMTLLCGLLLHFPLQAEVTHVSLNQRLFDLGKLPLIKVNIVSAPTDLQRLQFLLRQQSGEEKLMVQPVNPYLLLLMGIEEVTDPNAVLLVQQYRVDNWQEIGQLPLFDPSVPVADPPDPARFSMYRNGSGQLQAHVPDAPLNETPSAPAAPMSAVVAPDVQSSADCLLDYHGRETLWRLASRYGKTWHTHVYAAALAIMEANPQAFVKNKPGQLRRDASLQCPQPAQWQRYADKKVAREKFEALQ
ncbi:FimV family protein [Shewanella sp. YIC-542]|uniref:type IV pilus assembly protein FimV n=1 Tax=Shewanella mytili TaxID=3377111 RepID=UPI00398EA622